MTSIENEILSCSALLPFYLGEGRRSLLRIIADRLKEFYSRDLIVNCLDALIIDMREIIGDYVVAAYIYTYVNGDIVIWSSNEVSMERIIVPERIVVLSKNVFEDVVKSLKDLSNGLVRKPKLLLSGKTKCLKGEQLECYISSYKKFTYRYDDISLQLKCDSSSLRIDTVMLADKFVSSLIEGTGRLIDCVSSYLPWRSRKFFAKKVKDEITDEALKYLSELAKKYKVVFPKTPEYMELFKIS